MGLWTRLDPVVRGQSQMRFLRRQRTQSGVFDLAFVKAECWVKLRLRGAVKWVFVLGEIAARHTLVEGSRYLRGRIDG